MKTSLRHSSALRYPLLCKSCLAVFILIKDSIVSNWSKYFSILQDCIIIKSRPWDSWMSTLLFTVSICVHVRSVISNFCDPMDCGPPGSSVYEMSQARIVEWVAISFSRGPSKSMSFMYSALVGRFFTTGVTQGNQWYISGIGNWTKLYSLAVHWAYRYGNLTLGNIDRGKFARYKGSPCSLYLYNVFLIYPYF